MKKLMKNKKGFVWLLFHPIGWILLAIAFALLVVAWFALKEMIIWIFIAAFIAAGLYLAVTGNWPAGLAISLIGIALMFGHSAGYVNLSWFKDGNYKQIMANIDIDHENVLKYSVFNARGEEGSIGLFAVFVDDEFKRVDYFRTGTTHHKYAYKNIFEKSFQNSIDLSEYVGTGEHDVKVYYDVTNRRYDTEYYAVDDYWNINKCNVQLVDRLSNKARIDQDTKNFNFKWLPCSKTKVSGKGNTLPLNVLGWQAHFYYEDLLADEVDMFRTLSYQNFTVTIGDGSSEPQADPEEPVTTPKTSFWDGIIDWFSNVFGSIQFI